MAASKPQHRCAGRVDFQHLLCPDMCQSWRHAEQGNNAAPAGQGFAVGALLQIRAAIRQAMCTGLSTLCLRLLQHFGPGSFQPPGFRPAQAAASAVAAAGCACWLCTAQPLSGVMLLLEYSRYDQLGDPNYAGADRDGKWMVRHLVVACSESHFAGLRFKQHGKQTLELRHRS